MTEIIYAGCCTENNIGYGKEKTKIRIMSKTAETMIVRSMGIFINGNVVWYFAFIGKPFEGVPYFRRVIRSNFADAIPFKSTAE